MGAVPLNYFIVSVVAVMFISMVADNLVDRAALKLDDASRDRIARRMSAANWWRTLDTIGIGLMLLGMAKAYGILRIGTSVQWGVPTVICGLLAICVASSMRAWFTSRAYNVEAPDSPAGRSAFVAALLVTGSEVALACGICWFVFSPLLKANPANAAGGTATPANVAQNGESPQKMLYVDEPGALKLLKDKDLDYLKLLVDSERVRCDVQNGRNVYRRDDISQEIFAGLPTVETLRENVLRIKAAREAAPPEPKKTEPPQPKESLNE